MSAKENQNATIYAGDVRRLRFPIEGDTAGSPATLTAPQGYWKLATGLSEAARANPVIEKTSSPAEGLVIDQEEIDDEEWWVAYVYLEEADTIDAPGVYYHQLRIVDGTGKVVTASGKLVVIPLIGS
jgi:hypothetical protein